MKVVFTYANGRERLMRMRDAQILSKLGRGSYLTRDMRSAQVAVPAAPQSDVPVAMIGAAEYREREGDVLPAEPPAKRKYTRKAKADE